MENPVFVLVHGAWGGSWCWRDLLTQLKRRHVRVRCIDLPSSRNGSPGAIALADDVSELVLATEGLEHVVLVGHSYGGMVITEAAPQVKGLRRLIYVAALVPLVGESATDVSRLVRVRTELDDAIEVEGEHLRLAPRRAEAALYGECSSETREWAISQLSSQTVASPVAATRLRLMSRLSTSNVATTTPLTPVSRTCSRRSTMNTWSHERSLPFLSHPHDLLGALVD